MKDSQRGNEEPAFLACETRENEAKARVPVANQAKEVACVKEGACGAEDCVRAAIARVWDGREKDGRLPRGGGL